MNGQANSPWFQRANAFLVANRNNQDGKWHTVNFLVQRNYCCIDNRVSIEEILQYLNTNGIDIGREAFQQTILGELKRDGIVATLVYPGPQGGVFIPSSEDEVREVTSQVLERIDSETRNLSGITTNTSFSNLISLLSQIISWIKNNL